MAHRQQTQQFRSMMLRRLRVVSSSYELLENRVAETFNVLGVKHRRGSGKFQREPAESPAGLIIVTRLYSRQFQVSPEPSLWSALPGKQLAPHFSRDKARRVEHPGGRTASTTL